MYEVKEILNLKEMKVKFEIHWIIRKIKIFLPEKRTNRWDLGINPKC